MSLATRRIGVCRAAVCVASPVTALVYRYLKCTSRAGGDLCHVPPKLEVRFRLVADKCCIR